MPGNWNSGRRPGILPFSTSEAEYRPPSMPEGLDDAGQYLWGTLVDSLIERRIVTVADEPALGALCEHYALWRGALATAKADPLDKDARSAVVGYWKSFQGIAAQFGCNRLDRQKLEPKVEAAEQDHIRIRDRGLDFDNKTEAQA